MCLLKYGSWFHMWKLLDWKSIMSWATLTEDRAVLIIKAVRILWVATNHPYIDFLHGCWQQQPQWEKWVGYRKSWKWNENESCINNQTIDAQSWSKPIPRDWQIHKKVVQFIWNNYGKAEVNLFTNRQLTA